MGDRVVEHHDVLRHHADRRAKRPLPDAADILPVDFHASGCGVVETEEEASHCRLPRAGRANKCRCATARNRKAHVLDGPGEGLLRISEADTAELDHRCARCREIELRGVRLVLHLRGLGQELAEVVHIDDGVDDHVVDRSQEVQGCEHVDDIRVHGNEITKLSMVLQHTPCSDDHATREGEVDDDLLEDVENRQGCLRRHGILLEAFHHMPVLGAFVLLGGEVLDRLIINEGVRKAVVQLVVLLRRLGPEALPPKCDLNRRIDVQVQVQADEDGQAVVLEVEHENERDSDSLGKGRDEVQEDVLHRLLRCLDASVHRADHVAHLLPKVPVQGQAVQMRKG
mmetsp:Transcript_22314/g.63872  ORF Transcript_22314/g.63872 Transcript_22314/m.63872 type:complete len:341 (-) Transcript_22314:1062-2084(-)